MMLQSNFLGTEYVSITPSLLGCVTRLNIYSVSVTYFEYTEEMEVLEVGCKLLHIFFPFRVYDKGAVSLEWANRQGNTVIQYANEMQWASCIICMVSYRLYESPLIRQKTFQICIPIDYFGTKE